MNSAELRASRSKHLTQATKGHFWNQERRHSPEVVKGEGRRYETSLTQLLNYLRSLELPTEHLNRLEKFCHQLEASAFSYVETRIEFSRASQQRVNLEINDWQKLMEQVDRSRRVAHDRLIDALRIVTRNYAKVAEENQIPWDLPVDGKKLLNSMTDGNRDSVAHAAIDFVWKIMDEEEADEKSHPART